MRHEVLKQVRTDYEERIQLAYKHTTPGSDPHNLDTIYIRITDIPSGITDRQLIVQFRYTILTTLRNPPIYRFDEIGMGKIILE